MFPLRSEIKELCSPHPGHAIPKCSWKEQITK